MELLFIVQGFIVILMMSSKANKAYRPYSENWKLLT